jgi:hypothetical protein
MTKSLSATGYRPMRSARAHACRVDTFVDASAGVARVSRRVSTRHAGVRAPQVPATRSFRNLSLLLSLILLTGCSRAPSFDLLGSFFPAWLVCVALGLLLTGAARQLILRTHVVLAVPILTYPSLTLLFTFMLWLVLFR